MIEAIQNTEAEGHAQIDRALEAGVNFIDTAELYPVAWNYGALTEKWIGNWLTKRTADGTVDRSKVYIATKINEAKAKLIKKGGSGSPF